MGALLWASEGVSLGGAHFDLLSPAAAAPGSSSSSGGCSSGSEATPGGASLAPGGDAVAPPAGPSPAEGAAEGQGAALEAVVCVPLPLPLRLGTGRGTLAEGGPPTLLQGPPLLILASPGYDALGGLQLDVGGDEVPCALLEGGGAFPPPPLDPHLPKTGTGGTGVVGMRGTGALGTAVSEVIGVLGSLAWGRLGCWEGQKGSGLWGVGEGGWGR